MNLSYVFKERAPILMIPAAASSLPPDETRFEIK
jgi:hypothetical protein